MTVRDPDGLALIIVEVPPEHPRRRASPGATATSESRSSNGVAADAPSASTGSASAAAQLD
jgi:hypothetical protein